jgi:hypothetical protein
VSKYGSSPNSDRPCVGEWPGRWRPTVPAEAVDALICGLDEAKAERVAFYRDATDQS